MIGALIAITAGTAGTISDGFGVMDRFNSLWESPIPTPMPFSREAVGESLIVVAEFDHATGFPDARAHQKIADAIRNAIRSLEIKNVRVEVLPDIVPSRAIDKAEAVGKLFNATTVIWGEETSVDMRVNLLNRREISATATLEPGAYGLEVSSRSNYVQPDNTEEMSAHFDSPLPGVSNNPWLPLVYSPLPVATGNVNVVETSNTFVTSYKEPQDYIQLITSDLPSQITFFALLPVAQIQLFNGNEQAALNSLERALSSRADPPPNDEVPNDDIGKVFREVARLHLSLARRISATRTDGWWQIASDHGQAAKVRLNQAIAAGLTEPLTYYYLGLAYERTREFPQSIDSYTTAMDLNPDDHLKVFILHDRAIAKFEYRDLQGAIADTDMELQLEPTAEGAYSLRARAHFEMADYKSTIADVDRVVELMGSSRYLADLIDIKAQSYIALKDYKKAVQTMQNLVYEVGPESREYAEKRLEEIKALAGE